MTTFSTDSPMEEETWWEIQHRFPNAAEPYYRDRWASTDVTQFGGEGVELVREARAAGNLSRFKWSSAREASAFLGRFAPVAELHKTTEFRVARVHARIEIEHVISMSPPPICGEFGYYGRGGTHRDSYCQRAPEHEGKHGPVDA